MLALALFLITQIDASAAECVRVVIPGGRQIIHVLDHHYVEKALFAECHRLEGAELDKRYAKPERA